ncbi:MAG: long-chain fatty acid transport protein [Myxococcota bacterium]|jgi:long-chain fatty acid transport protein
MRTSLFFTQLRTGLTLVLALTITLGAASSVQAGGFYLPERGARALAMGGAQVAGADDLNAQWLNPAALIRLNNDITLYLDIGLILTSQTFLRANDPEVMRKDPGYAGGFPEVSNEGAPFIDPSLGIATNFGLDNWVFALGVYGPYAGSNEWDPDGPQRYSLHSLEAVQIFGQLSAAYRVNKRFSVGLGLQWVVVSIKQRLSISGYPGVFGWAEQRDLDVLAEVDVSDSFTPGANVGFLIEPIDGFEIGISGQLPVTGDAAGTLDVRIPDHYYFSDVDTRGDQIEVTIAFPAILRLGLRLFDESWSIELASVYEIWSLKQSIDVAPGEGGLAFDNVPGIGTYNVKPFSIEQRYQDVISVRLGGWFEPTKGIKLRAGTFFENSALPPEALSVLKFDSNKLGFGLGATIELGAFDIDLAAAYIHFFEQRVTNSIKTQVNPMYDVGEEAFGDGEPHTVGNGTYNGSNLIFATTLHASF